jgi:hypothetical protein
MFQFGNLANPRFIKGECSVKIECENRVESKEEENAKKGGGK